MATPAIGTVSFATMRGFVAIAAQGIEDKSRKGLNGHEYIKIGTRGEPSELVTVADFTTAVLAAAHITACVALQGGNPLTVTYADANTITNVQVLKCVPGQIHDGLVASGGLSNGRYIVTIRWLMQHTGVI